MWPWLLGLLALVLLPFLFMRDRGEETAAVPDTAALIDTTSGFGGRTTSAAAGSVAPAADTTANTQPRDRSRTRGAAASPDTSARADTAAGADTTTRR